MPRIEETIGNQAHRVYYYLKSINYMPIKISKYNYLLTTNIEK